ncbi:tyrosine-type recombinase/integrase [Streptomyces luteolifulvus]|uniref:Tyrosine-type recombinase/integrase n=1 Tax=Streptomyces luteolifulvus TaxID=2615112 RepID=A0A6H9UQ27_9ACTN|nr:tyrosine-type recombinase/integrase [Streptomyces luteolifulvus]
MWDRTGCGKTKPCWARVTGPLAPFADGFRAESLRLGHTPLTAATHLRLMAGLSNWLAEHDLSVSALSDAAVVAEFFESRRAAGYTGLISPKALQPMIAFLREGGALPPSVTPAPADATESLLEGYAVWMRRQRGLAETTVALNLRLVRPFLAGRVRADGSLDTEGLSAAAVNAYVVDQAAARPRSAKRIVTALRSLLTFLHVEGMIDSPLAASVPSPAGWTLAGLPKALPRSQVAALLASCDKDTGTGRRDTAILLLMARLGLRAGEVAALGLDDVHWRTGEITVRGKGGRCDRLPLPVDVGAAIADYLRHGRPTGALARTVFIRAQAPFTALATAAVIQVVDAAGRRSGTGVTGAHRLRHSAATAMLAAGGSLEEIGQVLRHVRPATTAIYAKADLPALEPLARPWPGTRAGT